MLDEPLEDEARFSEPLFDVELFAGVLELPDEADFDRDVLVDRGAFAATVSTTAFNAPTAAPVAAPARMSPAASTTFSTAATALFVSCRSSAYCSSQWPWSFCLRSVYV